MYFGLRTNQMKEGFEGGECVAASSTQFENPLKLLAWCSIVGEKLYHHWTLCFTANIRHAYRSPDALSFAPVSLSSRLLESDEC